MEHEQHEIEALQNETDSGSKIIVFDIPFTATADEAERLVNEPYERGFYVFSVAPWHGQGSVGARVFAKRLNPPRTAKPVGPGGPLTKEARAIQFLRDNREMTPKQLFAAFKALGVTRSEQWINEKRSEIIRTERRVI